MRLGLVTAVVLGIAACSHGAGGAEASPTAVALPRPVYLDEPRWAVPIGAERGERERCIDRELSARNLNEFGDAAGTTYAPGSPILALTDRSDRYRYVMQRHPDIAVQCTRAPLQP